ncbi:hypothetical protein [Paenibacillus terrigena]|uniref:hypothetical protein n=1 Tax=Paenibacillus terrigena TaxID=369333 RepID=UPI00037C66F5|nr:hypothetical protein [Paenibacillus terrigena]
MSRKVYILLTDTGTWFSKLIGLYTRAKLNHASIVLDEEMKEVYSFGRKNSLNPLSSGFVKEEVFGNLVRAVTRRTECELYCCTVSEETYERMRLQIRHMEYHQHKYKYNFLGLFGVVFNISIERKNAFFCSQFVAYMLQKHGVPIVNKSIAQITPEDLQNCESLELIYSGDLRQKAKNLHQLPMTS